jgi:Cys-tRNA(Pro)/Cys-tRNA(Cys) deacylase
MDRSFKKRDTIQNMRRTSPVTEALDELGIPYRLHIHDHPLQSIEQAARERGLESSQIIRSLLFRLEDDSFILLLMAGPGKVDWTKLRRYLGVSRMTTATTEQVRMITGYEPGAVSPFGLRHPLRMLADWNIQAHEVISLGAGIQKAGVIIKRDDLLKAIQFEMGDFRETQVGE